MKKIFTLLLVLVSFQAWTQKITISIDQDITPEKIKGGNYNFENYLVQNLITFKIDTVKAIKGQIALKNNTKTITPFAVARMQPRQAMVFFVEPEKDFILRLSEPTLAIKATSGSNAQADYTKFMAVQAKLQTESQAIQAAMTKDNTNDSLRKRSQYLQLQSNAEYVSFVNQQKDNNLGAYLVFDVANKNQRIAAKDLKGIYDKLSTQGKSTHFGKLVGNRVNRLTAMDIGSTSPDFTLKDAKGKKHTLSSLKGKYVLIDFWASWCGPCVREIPHLKKAYQKYHDKGFEIMSVSIDRKREQWLKAVDKYKMPWISVVDHADNAKKITQTLYYVPTIPRTVLLDKNGKVIGKDFRGAELEHQLAKLLDKK